MGGSSWHKLCPSQECPKCTEIPSQTLDFSCSGTTVGVWLSSGVPGTSLALIIHTELLIEEMK